MGITAGRRRQLWGPVALFDADKGSGAAAQHAQRGDTPDSRRDAMTPWHSGTAGADMAEPASLSGTTRALKIQK